MNVLVDIEDFTIKILNCHDEYYTELTNGTQVREIVIYFKELHEKLLS